MTDLIRRIAVWLWQVLAPGSGRRRAGFRPVAAAPAVQPRTAPGAGGRWLPVPRSPYGLREVFDGDAVALVRPYLVEYERRRERARRRLVLVLAADFGIDLDMRDVHGAGVAR